MKKLSFIATLLTVLLLAPAFVLADDETVEERHHIKLKLMHDGELVDLDVEDLAIGESRQFLTDSGKEVIITRQEEGIELTVDGKEIDISGGHGGHHMEIHSEEGDGHHTVRVEKRVIVGEGGECEHGDECEDHAFVWHGADGSVTTSGDGGHNFVFIKKPGILEHLEGTDVWNRLDEATRQELMDEIKKAEQMNIHKMHEGHGRRIEVKVSSDEDE